MISDNHTRELKYLEKLRKSQLSSWQVTPNPVFCFYFFPFLFLIFLIWAVRKIALGVPTSPILWARKVNHNSRLFP